MGTEECREVSDSTRPPGEKEMTGTGKGTMSREEKIKKLQQALEAEEKRVQDMFKVGKIPGKEDYLETDRLKIILKVEKTLLTKEAKRTNPLLTKRFGVKLSEAEHSKLFAIAEAKGLGLSELIRGVIRKHLLDKVDERGDFKG